VSPTVTGAAQAGAVSPCEHPREAGTICPGTRGGHVGGGLNRQERIFPAAARGTGYGKNVNLPVLLFLNVRLVVEMKTYLITALVLLALSVLVTAAAAQSFRTMYESGTVEFVEDLFIGGTDDGDEDYILYGPSEVCVDAAGNIFVLDYKMNWVKKFDRNGAHVRTFSRSGEGPGELSQPIEMAITPGGNIVIYELGNQRFSFFGNDGDYLRTHNYQGVVEDLECAPDGTLYAVASGWDFDPDKGALFKVIRFSSDMARSTDIDSAYVKNFQMIAAGHTVSSPFPTRLVCAVTPAGEVVVGHADAYVLKVLSPNLEVVREIRRDVKRIKVTDEDKSDYYNGFKNSDDPTFGQRLKQNVAFPRYKPYFYDVFVDPEGHILVETYDVVDKKPLHDVFTSEGEFIGQVRLPDLNRAVFKDGFMYRIKYTEDHVPGVARFRAGGATGAAETTP
jgi:hypothetical protein